MINVTAARVRALLERLYWSARSRVAASRIQRVQRNIAAGNALKDKVAVVTGASSGIGFAIARAFARAGACCVLVVIDPDGGAAAVNALATEGLRVNLRVADVSNGAQVRELARDVHNQYEKVDILVNNAGVFLDEDREMQASGVDDAVVERTLAVNLYGAVHTCTAFAPLMAKGGRIINISSVMGLLSHPSDGYASAYRLSKAALNSYTQSLAADFQARNVMVDCVHPGWVKTKIGGPKAQIDAAHSTDTVFFLATRSQTKATGLFWWDGKVIRW